MFLCSPNNPTGNLLDEGRAARHVPRRSPDRALVCVDEAYIEFAGRASLASRLAEFPNLVVLRTLSKAYALAGARLGTLIASEDIVALLKRIIPPYAIPASTVEEVLALTEAPQRAMAAARIRTLLDERARTRAAAGCHAQRRARVSRPTPTSCWCSSAMRAGRWRLARPWGCWCATSAARPASQGCLRISIGTPEQNERLLAALEQP